MTRGFHVSFPAANPSYDIIVDACGKLSKVQIKTSSTMRGNKYRFDLRSITDNKRTPYTWTECDIIVVHPVETDWFGILLPEEFLGKSTFTLDMNKHRYLLNNYNRLCTPK
jgi:hypothetical protein